MKIKILLLFLILYSISAFKLPPLNFRHTTQQKNIPERIYAAQIHYCRVPYQYWEHRLQMIKAMGFNALSVYVMWNFHQIEKEKLDFENQDRNLKLFLQLAKKLNFYVLLRPGPYICAEWDFGGLPARLLSNKNITIRSNNKEFLEQVKTYFTALSPIIKQNSAQNNGSIILLQIQNEYGQFGSDKDYITALRQLWKDLNITLPEYFVDAYFALDRTYWQGAAAVGMNGVMAESYYADLKKKYPNSYIFGGEIYSGWMTHWGEYWVTKYPAQFLFQFNFLMSYNHSFSMYMAHGGTNFGLWAGANTDRRGDSTYWPTMTTYDYDAPINQQGAPNEKYHIFRSMVQKYTNQKLSDIPSPIPTMEIPSFTPVKFADMFANLPKPMLTQVADTVTFEDQRLKMFNQGFVLYQTFLKSGFYVINVTVHDFALVYQDGRFLRYLDRTEADSHLLNVLCNNDNSKLQILVEAMGHVNFNMGMLSDFKGITNITFWNFPNNQAVYEKCKSNYAECPTQTVSWNIYPIPIDQNMLRWTQTSDTNSFPRLFRYKLNLNDTNDTYLNMQNWGKGYVFVNGKNLGRYWKKGPQQRLYLPGVWLKKGDNDIVVLDLLNGNPQAIKGERALRSSQERQKDIQLQEKFSRQNIKNSLFSFMSQNK